MSKATSILEENYTAFPNELIRNRNDIMTKNERHLMIYLWDKLYGYQFPKSELSYSMILQDCKDFPKNNRKLSEAVQGLERKGLLKVFRKHEKTNKYYIGEKQVKCLQWYGKNFKGWKNGEIDLPQEFTETEKTIQETGLREKTPFEDIVDMEIEQQNKGKNNQRKFINEESIKPPDEKQYLYQLSPDEFNRLFPDMDIVFLTMYSTQTIEKFTKTAEGIRKRKNEIKKQEEQSEKQKQEEIERLDKELIDIINSFS
jgi:hypothetical protein